MKLEITGDPGTGNTYIETNIAHVENYNPNAKTVINNYNHYNESKGSDKKVDNEHKETQELRQEILNYVGKLRIYLNNEWKSSYINMWNDILDIQVVSDSIYNPGKQKGTNFNRNLVANILCYLNDRKAFKDYNVSSIAEVLEGKKESSIRLALSKDPKDEIVSRLDRYFDSLDSLRS